MSKQIQYCEHCNFEIKGDFCSNCGRAKVLKRIDGRYILSEIGSLLNFEKGILYTIKELLIRPGKNVQNFILKDRNRLVKPIVFIVVCSLIYTILQQLMGFEDEYVNYSFDKDSAITTMFEWVTDNYGYANLLISIFIALWIKLLFRKHNYNFFEILILLCYVIGMEMLIFTFFGVIDSLVNINVSDMGFLIGVLYIAWGIGQFFKGNKFVNSLKGLLSYMMGVFSFAALTIIAGVLIDLINK